MKRLAFCFALCLATFLARAQRDFGHLLAGLETGFDVTQLDGGEKPRIIPSAQVEVPIGQFALGVGFGRKFFQSYDYYLATGQTVMRVENGQSVLYYVSDVHSFKPAYWTVPLKFEWRGIHPCECVFLHLGVDFNFLDKNAPDHVTFTGAETRESPLSELRHDQLFKAKTYSYNLGVGFNLYANDFLRFTALPAYVWSQNPEVYTDAPWRQRTFRMSFAVQFSIL